MSHPWHGKDVITSLAVYAPNDSEKSLADFYDSLADLFLNYNLPTPDLLFGDLNMVEESIDRLPESEDAAAVIRAHRRIKSLLGLQDGWRNEHPDEKEFTYSHVDGHMSRIDRILSDEVLPQLGHPSCLKRPHGPRHHFSHDHKEGYTCSRPGSSINATRLAER